MGSRVTFLENANNPYQLCKRAEWNAWERSDIMAHFTKGHYIFSQIVMRDWEHCKHQRRMTELYLFLRLWWFVAVLRLANCMIVDACVSVRLLPLSCGLFVLTTL